jgi:hypothetical protein
MYIMASSYFELPLSQPVEPDILSLGVPIIDNAIQLKHPYKTEDSDRLIVMVTNEAIGMTRLSGEPLQVRGKVNKQSYEWSNILNEPVDYLEINKVPAPSRLWSTENTPVDQTNRFGFEEFLSVVMAAAQRKQMRKYQASRLLAASMQSPRYAVH